MVRRRGAGEMFRGRWWLLALAALVLIGPAPAVAATDSTSYFTDQGIGAMTTAGTGRRRRRCPAVMC
jgi:hypothetical protein